MEIGNIKTIHNGLWQRDDGYTFWVTECRGPFVLFEDQDGNKDILTIVDFLKTFTKIKLTNYE